MSKFLKRLGTKKHVYSVDITLHSIQVAANNPIRIQIYWSRNKKKVETKNKYAISKSINVVEINETLTMPNTFYQKKSGEFQSKIATLTIVAYLEDRTKRLIGDVKLDLVQFINQQLDNQSFLINSCPDKNAKLTLSVRAHSLGETSSDYMSEGSSVAGEGEISSGVIEEESVVEEERKVTSNKKPPVHRKASDSKFESPPLEGKERYIELKAAKSLLEKENQQLRSEKEDLKVQLEILAQKAKKEREMFCEQTSKLDGESDRFKYENNKLKEKISKDREKLQKLHKNHEEALLEIENLKATYNQAEKLKFLDTIKILKKSLFDSEEKITCLSSALESLQSEYELTENSKDQLQSLNLKYLSDISHLKRRINEQQEVIASKLSEEQGPLKKRLETMASDMKKDLEEVLIERDDIIAKNTDLLIEIQKLKKNFNATEHNFKQKIRKAEFEIDQKSHEIQILSERLEDEIKSSKNFERKTISEKEELDDKLIKLKTSIKEVSRDKEVMEKKLTEQHRNYSRNRSETETDNYSKLQKNLISYQNDIKKLNLALKLKEEEIKELLSKVSLLESKFELSALSSSNFEDFSNFSQSALIEKISNLKAQLESNNSLYLREKSVLTEKLKLIEKELEISIQKGKDTEKKYEDQIAALRIENITLQDGKHLNIGKPSDFVNTIKEETLKQTIEMKKIENKELKNLIVRMTEELKTMEKKYLDFKMTMANTELERENAMRKFKDSQNSLAEYSEKVNLIENEFYKVNEKFGQALNQNNDLWNETEALKGQISVLMNKRRKKH